jgi:hypothetical protein
MILKQKAVCLISRLGADASIFQNLDFKNVKPVFIKWIVPQPKEREINKVSFFKNPQREKTKIFCKKIFVFSLKRPRRGVFFSLFGF